MASSLYFPGKYYFYPVGNTSAVCLTRDIPPDLDANILLLPCGDPRNVLYTVFCEESSRSTFHFVQHMRPIVVDVDLPSQLAGPWVSLVPISTRGSSVSTSYVSRDPRFHASTARNTLLLTMIMDRIAAPTMWNIFFHMYLDLDSRATLVSQSRKLAAYSSVDSWRSSPYGTVIKMGTDHTFAEMRRHWELYAEFYHPSKLTRLRTLRAKMDSKLKKAAQGSPGFNITSSRSAGPLFGRFQSIRLIGEQFQRYWETGTTPTNRPALAPATHPNSTFFYSRAGEGFDIHYGTDPMIPFHHAPLFGNTKRTLSVGDLVESAKSQFKDWCSSFQNVATSRTASGPTRGALIVRFILGEALAVARALRDFPEHVDVQAHPFATPTVTPWTTCAMELNREEYTDFGAPSRFDVIDTSNLSDHIGMLNMLLATVPLLAGSPSSVLYTETLLTHSADPSTELESKLFASLSVVATLIDLAPVDALSGFTTRCNTHELVSTAVLDANTVRQHHQTLTWRRPSSGDLCVLACGRPPPPMSFDTPKLAKVLHSVYVQLYKSDDPMSLLSMNRNNVMGAIK